MGLHLPLQTSRPGLPFTLHLYPHSPYTAPSTSISAMKSRYFWSCALGMPGCPAAGALAGALKAELGTMPTAATPEDLSLAPVARGTAALRTEAGTMEVTFLSVSARGIRTTVDAPEMVTSFLWGAPGAPAAQSPSAWGSASPL